MTSREQFEAKFPVPAGVTWNPETSRYVLTELRNTTVTTYEAHVERWVVWQAAQESLRNELTHQSEEPLADGKALMDQIDAEAERRYREAEVFVRESRLASISAIQRKFKIGYGPACRLMNELVQRGVVTDIDSHGRREVIAEARP